MKVRISENEFVFFNETQQKIIIDATAGMLAGRFVKLAEPFINYDKKRLEKLGLRTQFAYSKRVLEILGFFSKDYSSLDGVIKKISDDASSNPGIKRFVDDVCLEIKDFYAELFSPKLKYTDFFKNVLIALGNTGSVLKEKIIEATPIKAEFLRREVVETIDVSVDFDVRRALVSCLQDVFKDSVFDALDSVRRKISEVKIEAVTQYSERLVMENEALRHDLESLKKRGENSHNPHHLDLVLDSVSIGIDLPASVTEPQLATTLLDKEKGSALG